MEVGGRDKLKKRQHLGNNPEIEPTLTKDMGQQTKGTSQLSRDISQQK